MAGSHMFTKVRLTFDPVCTLTPSAQRKLGGKPVQALRHPLRFLSILVLVLSAALLGTAGPAAAANPLLCFDGTTDGGGFHGTCTLVPGGAVLNTIDGDSNPNNNYAGVYYAESSLSGQDLEDVSASFSYAAGPGTTATGGAPRLSIPIDEDGDGTTEFYAFVDTLGCNNGSPNVGTLSLSDPTCTVAYGGGGSWVSWAAFAAANPTWTVSDDLPFVIVDQPGIWTITNVELGQGEDADVATDKDECKNGGWADLTREDGSSFKNQGDCIQYVNTGN